MWEPLTIKRDEHKKKIYKLNVKEVYHGNISTLLKLCDIEIIIRTVYVIDNI